MAKPDHFTEQLPVESKPIQAQPRLSRFSASHH